MSGTIYVDPGGVVIDGIEVNGFSYNPLGGSGGGIGYVISPLTLFGALFPQPLLFGGGLADLFCAHAVPDTGNANAVPDTFVVPPGKTSC